MASEARAWLDEQIASLKRLGQQAESVYLSLAVLPSLAKRADPKSFASNLSRLVVTTRRQLDESLDRADHWLGRERPVYIPIPGAEGNYPSACEGAFSLLQTLAVLAGIDSGSTANLAVSEKELTNRLQESFRKRIPDWVLTAPVDTLKQLADVAVAESRDAIARLTANRPSQALAMSKSSMLTVAPRWVEYARESVEEILSWRNALITKQWEFDNEYLPELRREQQAEFLRLNRFRIDTSFLVDFLNRHVPGRDPAPLRNISNVITNWYEHWWTPPRGVKPPDLREVKEATLEDALAVALDLASHAMNIAEQRLRQAERRGDKIASRREASQPAEPSGFMGGEALADALGVHPSRRTAFFKQLERDRRSLDDEHWQEVTNRRANSPRYQYRADSPNLRELADRYKNSIGD